ncbi:MAG: hypothetical protein LBU45_02340 [Azoarcus sp.]|jgi:hypothetical protein|nr:hypothetical protein [Azoarcus sp.]
MKFQNFLAILLLPFVNIGCSSMPQDYSGKGGMTAYTIKPEAYLYHYKNGFTGVDAIGWDPNLQYVWSRLGAAKTCGIKFDQDKTVEFLTKKFEAEKWVHEINGIGFHNNQSKAIPGFCTDEKLKELSERLPQFERGDFPKIY